LNSIFDELTRNLKELSRRITKFETWEPASGIADTGAHAYLAANQLILAGAYTQVLFDAELWDTNTIHAGGTFTIPSDGKYQVNVMLWCSGTLGPVYIRVYKSATENFFDDKIGTVQGFQISGIMQCAAGDTIIIELYGTNNITLLGSAVNGYQSFGQIQRVG
jgi:hypothetical protein